LYILIAILMFGIMIALHEFGHFAAAKLCGVKVNEFAIGMGPKLLRRTKGDTEYTLRLFPIGGFCAMEGEEEDEKVSDDPRAFPNRPWWQRLIILLAGVLMNFLTGFFIILCFFSTVTSFLTPQVRDFTPEGTAQSQGLLPGDRITKVDNHAIFLKQDIEFFIAQGGDAQIDLEVERDGKRLELKDFELSPQSQSDGSTAYRMGIWVEEEPNTAGSLLKNTWLQSIDYIRMVWYSLGQLFRGAVGLRDMSSVVEITKMMGEAGEEGAQAAQAAGGSALLGALANILWIVAFISINLSVMNLLPIPALDGGQIFFMAVNGVLLALRGRKLDPKYQGWVTAAGFIFLLLLMAVVMASDILKLFGI